ncbi:MAG TPA: SPOR domain-containing protein [Burkholderiaceae bacterium]|jgi:DedD protein|nr:SPOR domain-containing protein [Burkholderiaceae bacterium]
MGFAFWRRKDEGARDDPADAVDPASDELDPSQLARVRARRRLVGAAALLIGAVVVVPLVLDREPKSVPDNIVIDIPSEKSRFTPKLSVPPAPVPDSAALVPPPDAGPASGKADAAPAPAKPEPPKPEAAKPEPAKSGPAKPEAAKPGAKAEEVRKSSEARPDPAKGGDKTADKPPAPAKGGKFAVQVAAPASEASARELQDKLKKQGYAAFLEKVETKDGSRWRVRAGPYATREDAEAARARLKAAGVAGNLVTL